MLASLIEKEATVPDSYPLSLNALRLACNQTTNRSPIVAYDDRTVEAALLSLKSIGLVRFVHPSHGGRTTRYRQSADERWHLSPAELAVLGVLVLRGPQTVGEIRSRVDRQHRFDDPGEVEDILDALVSRGPEPLAARVESRPGERDVRFADLLTGDVPAAVAAPTVGLDDRPPPSVAGTSGPPRDDLVAQVAELRRRLDRLERLLGAEEADPPFRSSP